MWYNKKCREYVGQTIALDRLTRMNEYNPPKQQLGGLLLFVAYYNIGDCYYTTYDADDSFNRNNYHSPSQKNSTKVCEFNLLSNQCGDGREVYRLFYTSEGEEETPTYSLQAILQHFCQNKSSYFEICHNAQKLCELLFNYMKSKCKISIKSQRYIQQVFILPLILTLRILALKLILTFVTEYTKENNACCLFYG